jgi:hypothetical protein
MARNLPHRAALCKGRRRLKVPRNAALQRAQVTSLFNLL